MENILTQVGINIYILLVAIVGVFIAGISLNMVSKTVGLSYAWKMFQMKKKHNKDKILLKVWLSNGSPYYIIKPTGNIIEYEYKENGRNKKASVIYDYYCMYKEFGGVPVLECNPNDIVPRNPFVNTSLTLSGEIIKKNIVDSSKEDLKHEDLKKWIKIALPLVIAFGVILVLYSSNQNEAILECTRQLASSTTAVINTGG